MLSIIAAVAQNGTIGDRNTLLWHITEDMQFFRRTTQGHPVIMGRKTYESLGRPLPKRQNVIISRQPLQIEGCTVVHSLQEAIDLFPSDEELFIIGGGQIYSEALPLADRMYLTIVEQDFAGDTLFPHWEREAWELRSSTRYERGEEFPHPFRFEYYERR